MENTIEIEIDSPVEKVFGFTTDPDNTPKWIPSVVKEWISNQNVQIGTLYYQVAIEDEQQVNVIYRVIEFEANKIFRLQRVGSSYVCCYAYTSTRCGKSTKLVYSEQVETGDEMGSFIDIQPFVMLKRLLEENK